MKGCVQTCQGLYGQQGDKQLPGIVALREASHKF